MDSFGCNGAGTPFLLRLRELRLPVLERDYVTCLAQNPADPGSLAFATRRRIANEGEAQASNVP